MQKVTFFMKELTSFVKEVTRFHKINGLFLWKTYQCFMKKRRVYVKKVTGFCTRTDTVLAAGVELIETRKGTTANPN